MQATNSETALFRDDQDEASLIEALGQTIVTIKAGPYAKPESEQLATLESFLEALKQHGFDQRLADTFTMTNPATALFTGYYQPELQGSFKRTSRACFPLYALPAGEIPVRSAIDSGVALAGRGLEIAWVEDSIDLFFLHIQGSGKLRLEDGSTREIQYAGNNGREYDAIGKILTETGALRADKLSMQSIKHYLRSHPEQCQQILNQNPRYIFFKLGENGPVGTLGAVLTPLRSIASDWACYAPGTLCSIETSLPLFSPDGIRTGSSPVRFFVINQDTGSAITGPNRVDLFTGSGIQAELMAGHLKEKGTISVINKKRLQD